MSRCNFDGWSDVIGEVPWCLSMQTTVRHEAELESTTDACPKPPQDSNHKQASKQERGNSRSTKCGMGREIENKKSELMLMRRATASGLISYAGCLGLSPVISAKIHSLRMRRSLKSRKIH